MPDRILSARKALFWLAVRFQRVSLSPSWQARNRAELLVAATLLVAAAYGHRTVCEEEGNEEEKEKKKRRRRS